MSRAKPGRFEALIAPHLAILFRAAYRLAGNVADAEDLVQDVCACRRLVTAPPVLKARRAGGRPFVVGGLLLAGAAAAVVGLRSTGGSGEQASLETRTEVVADPVPAAGDTLLDEPASDPSPLPVAQRAGVVEVPAAVAGQGTAPSEVTVAVTPLRQRATNPEAIRMTEMVYLALLDALRRIPNLVLIELETADEETSATAVGAGPSFPGVGSGSGSGSGSGAGRTADAGITNLGDPDSPESTPAVTLVGSRSFSDADSSGVADPDALPSALVGRIATLTGGASASDDGDAIARVINVILDDNVDGLRLDLSVDAIDGDAEPLPYDFQLDVIGSDSGDSWQLSVQGRGRSGQGLSAGVGSAFGARSTAAEPAARLVEQLRQGLFPPDASLIAAIESRVRDWSLSPGNRYRALLELDRIAGRADDAGLNAALVDGAMAIAAASADPDLQASIWRMLRGKNDTRLIRPLSDALLYAADETVRLEAAMTLAEYADDTFARAVLSAAGQSDPASSVKTYTRWMALDDAGRREHVVSTLLNEQLTDVERLAALELVPGPYTIGIRDIGLDAVIDSRVAAALTELIQRSAPVSQRRALLSRLGALDAPNLAPVLIERLTYDADESVRSTAATALPRYLEEPGARSARASSGRRCFGARAPGGKARSRRGAVVGLSAGQVSVAASFAFRATHYYTVEQMAGRENLLGPHEQVVLLAILRIGEGAYGMTIRREVEQRAGRKLSIGSVYTALERLQRKGYVRSRLGEPTTERGGRAKRHYRVTAKGERALRESHDLLRSMTDGLELGWETK